MTAEPTSEQRVLIVDDDPTNIDVLVEQLSGAGFAVAVAEDGERALEQSQYDMFDLILLDIILPGIDGFETCRRLKAHERTNTIPVIFMTSLTDVANKVKGFQVGGVDYITKPFQQAEVLARVQTHLAMRDMRQQLLAHNLRLQQEIAERQRAEAALQQAYADLEQRVAARTSELAAANASLQAEIVERERAEEQLRQAQKMEAIGRLTGGVAHDFNNILTVIIGNCHLVLSDLGLDHLLRPDIEQILNVAERAAALTRRLLAFSRQQVLQPKVMNLNTVVTNIDKLLRRLIGEDIDLVTLLDSRLGQVKADPGQIEQVIINLAVNARDAMPRGGRLTIETANVYLDAGYARQHVGVVAGHYVMLAISDTGIGMDADTRAHMFEPFFTTKEPGKGTGLGLATVHGIVHQSDGHIWLYTEPGQGTTFKIYLPRLDESVESDLSAPIAVKSRPGVETILLVEDDDLIRGMARRVLLKQGYKVLEASTGEHARQISAEYEGSIQLLLSDVVMPGGMSGPQLAEDLGLLHPEMKILYMSGYTDSTVLHYGVLEVGAAFLQKPFTPNLLLEKVRNVLDGREDAKL